MQAVIIASGEGKRMSQKRKDSPKPLLKLLGLTLIERVILSLKQTGVVEEILIVVGYQGEKIKKTLGGGEKYGVKINYIENPYWRRGNGISVVRAKNQIKGNFLLLMADHIFEYTIVKEIVKEELNGYDAVLAVDTTPAEYLDVNDATKVKLESDKIVQIGKHLEEYEGFDCGIFLCSPKVFEYLQEAISQGKESLTDGMQKIASVGRLKAFDIGEKFWIDIDTPSTLQEAQRILCRRIGKESDGFISRRVNRPISLIFTRYLVKTNLTPNSISLLSFALCVVAGMFFMGGSYFLTVIGGIITQLASILDGCDGEVARLKFKVSEYGGWFDALLDRYADAFVILGMVLGILKSKGGISPWIWGFVAISGSFTNSYSAAKYDLIRKFKKRKWRFGRDTRYFIIFLGALFNQLYFTLISLGVITNFISLRRMWVLRKD